MDKGVDVRRFLTHELHIGNESAVDAILRMGEVKEYKLGETFCKEGDPSWFLGFLINDGLFRGYYLDESGKEVTECFVYGVGQSVIDRFSVDSFQVENVVATLVAMETSLVLRVPILEIKKLLMEFEGLNAVAFNQTAHAGQWHLDMKNMMATYHGKELVRQFELRYPDLFRRLSTSDIASFLNVSERTIYRSRGHRGKKSGDEEKK